MYQEGGPILWHPLDSHAAYNCQPVGSLASVLLASNMLFLLASGRPCALSSKSTVRDNMATREPTHFCDIHGLRMACSRPRVDVHCKSTLLLNYRSCLQKTVSSRAVHYPSRCNSIGSNPAHALIWNSLIRRQRKISGTVLCTHHTVTLNASFPPSWKRPASHR